MTVPATESLQQQQVAEQAEQPNRGIEREITARAQRGWDLHLAKRQLITRAGKDTYYVPGTAGQTYIVRYGDAVESCSCTDSQVHGDRVACKHLVAVALLYAARRRPACPCFGGYITLTFEEDGQEYDGAVPCRACAPARRRL